MLLRCLPVFVLACEGAGPAEVAVVSVAPPRATDPIAEASPSLAALAGTQWQGARPKMNVEMGTEHFDYADPDVAFVAIFNADGSGHGLSSWWGESCADGQRTCALQWKAVGDELELRAPEPDSLVGTFEAHILNGELHLFTEAARLPDKTGTVRLRHGLETLRVEAGQCTLETRGAEVAHTAPCAFAPAEGHEVLTFEGLASDGTVSLRRLRWYRDLGLLVPPPAYVLRTPASG